MSFYDLVFGLLFPPKCVVCRRVLSRDETDLCRPCREDLPEFANKRKKIPYIAEWTAVWYYENDVRKSILRYKFRNARSYAEAYGRLLAMRLLREDISVDLITWVPVSAKRRRKRGYDQVELIAHSVAAELGMEPVRLLKKVRDNPPQSSQRTAEARRANVLGVYQAVSPEIIASKHVLLLDDIVTTGATAGECARVLLTAGAAKVSAAAVAAVRPKDKNRKDQ